MTFGGLEVIAYFINNFELYYIFLLLLIVIEIENHLSTFLRFNSAIYENKFCSRGINVITKLNGVLEKIASSLLFSILPIFSYALLIRGSIVNRLSLAELSPQRGDKS